jgi:insertion element IS1 protein InsB
VFKEYFTFPDKQFLNGLKKIINILPSIEETLIYPKDDALEFDEICSFVQKKSNKRWTWLGISRVTGQIVSYFVGDRSMESCKEFKQNIPEKYEHTFSHSDLWASYAVVFPELHLSSQKGSGETCHIERFNNTIRQRVARYSRKTIAFSKSDYWHDLITKLFIIFYNLSRRI